VVPGAGTNFVSVDDAEADPSEASSRLEIIKEWWCRHELRVRCGRGGPVLPRGRIRVRLPALLRAEVSKINPTP